MVSKRNLLGLVVLVVIVVAVAGYYFLLQHAPPDQLISRVTIAQTWPTDIDPCTMYEDYSSQIAVANIYDTLVYLDFETGEVIPFVAESWDVSDDGLDCAFYLRNDVKFHDGSILTADDVRFSMDRMLEMGRGYAYAMIPYIQSTEVVGDYTIIFHLKKPIYCLGSILFESFSILNEDLVMDHLDPGGEFGEMGDYGLKWLRTHDAGSGPYYVEEFLVESELTLRKFGDYWLENTHPNRPEEIRIIPVDEYITQRTMFQNRELEFNHQFMAREHYLSLSEIPGVEIVDATGGDLGMWPAMCIKFHMTRPPVDCIHLRKALAWAFDYQTYCLEIGPGYGTAEEQADWESRRSYGMCSPNVPGTLVAGVDMQPRYERNMTNALEELQQSKYFHNISQYTIDCDYAFGGEKLALLFASSAQDLAELADVTINIKLVNVPWSVGVDKWSKNETSPATMAFGWWVQKRYGEVSGVLGDLCSPMFETSSSNYWKKNATYEELYSEALQTLDKEERFAIYASLQRYIWNQCPAIFIGSASEPVAYQAAYIDWYVPRDKVYPWFLRQVYDFRYIGMDPEKRQELIEGK